MNNNFVNNSVRNQVIEQSKHGHHLLKIRNYAEARKVFEEALRLAPDDIYLMTGLADALRQQKDFSEATVYYRKVLEIDPYNPFALRGLGDALRGQFKYEEAIEFWKKYLHLKGSKDVFVLTRIADCYKTLERHDESKTYYQKALTLDPNDRYSLIGLADLYHKQGLELSAIDYYEKALANGVTLINILTIVANLHCRQGNYERARIYYEKTLTLDPDNTYALYGLGTYYRWKNDYQKAVELWERIRDKNAVTVNLLTRLGDAYRNLGQYEAAERAYKENLEKGYDMFTLLGMIKLHIMRERLQEACDCYDELLRNNGDDGKFFAELGDLFVQREERGVAVQFLHHARKRRNGDSSVILIIEDRIRQLEGF